MVMVLIAQEEDLSFNDKCDILLEIGHSALAEQRYTNVKWEIPSFYGRH
jgi:hypothetical protein